MYLSSLILEHYLLFYFFVYIVICYDVPISKLYCLDSPLRMAINSLLIFSPLGFFKGKSLNRFTQPLLTSTLPIPWSLELEHYLFFCLYCDIVWCINCLDTPQNLCRLDILLFWKSMLGKFFYPVTKISDIIVKSFYSVNYYVKCLSDNLSNENKNTGVSRKIIFPK